MEKNFIFGSRKKGRALLNIGKYYALDSSLGSKVFIDISMPHVILIAGKRGYGKSYTIGVFMEEFYMLDDDIKNKLSMIVIDTLGIFWSSYMPNEKEKDFLKKWGMNAEGIKIKIISTQKMVDEYKTKGIDAIPFSLKPSQMGFHHWHSLFHISPFSQIGIAITDALNDLEGEYSIDNILNKINESNFSDEVKVACKNLFKMAKSWEIFSKDAISIYDIAKKGEITVLDLSQYPDELKDVILSIIAQKIFEARVVERKREELKEKSRMPMVLLAIDEAHVFLSKNKISRSIFINQWMRQGRQPGLSLILATQMPSSLDKEVISHADIIISHRLTAQQDIEALNEIRPTYMKGEIKDAIKKIGTEKGVALIIDDVSEVVSVIKIRPRISMHGGNEPFIT